MLKNYFKTTWRNLKRNKAFTVLNIAGLAVGIACSALIFLWVEYQVTYNESIPDLNNIYDVKNTQTYGGDMYTFSATPALARDALLQEFPGVVNVTRYNSAGATISLNNKHLPQSGAYVDSSFLKIFQLPVIEGNAMAAANDISQIAISQKLAKNYFGDGNAIGKALMVDTQPYKVAAIYKDIPQNVQFYGTDFLLPYQAFYDQYKTQGIDTWGNNWTDTWVQLNPHTNVIAFNKKLSKLVQQKNPQVTNQSLSLYPLKRMTLYGGFTNGKEDKTKGLIKYVSMFTIVALIILFIACINFMNLSTARSEKRAKEIGMRKVMGSSRINLVIRLLIESLFISYMAVILALLIVACVLPMFSNLIGLHLEMHVLFPSHLLFLLGIGLLCGMVAGSYPALFLSSFNPIKALKNQVSNRAGNASIVRKSLVVIQFTISVFIIIAVIVIYQQMQYTRNRDLGFNKDNILYVSATPSSLQSFSSLKQSLLNTGAVADVALGSSSPLSMYSNGGGYNWDGKNENEDVLVTQTRIDANYLNTFGIQLKEGRNFNTNPDADSDHVIINEAFARLMGKAGHVGGEIWRGDKSSGYATITGITKNFVYNDVNQLTPAPLAFYNYPDGANFIFLKLKAMNNLSPVITALQNVFTKADASVPFDYKFIDKNFEQKFKEEKFISTLSTIFGALAIFISCLGLFGLSAFMAEQRKKEIGVRKVLGASVPRIAALVSKDFLKLVGVSCLVAFPAAWWIMSGWLHNYEYRIEISWLIFFIAGIVAMLIAIVTISFQSIKAAIANPVKSLRS
ncbi:MAG: ABC transporter permease [Ginsengibacter sp.]